MNRRIHATFGLVLCASGLALSQTRPATQPTTQKMSREAIVAEITDMGLPPLSFSGESRVRFDIALRKLDLDKRRRLYDLIDLFRTFDDKSTDLLTLLPMQYFAADTLPTADGDEEGTRVLEPDRKSTSPVRRQAAMLELASRYLDVFEDAQRRGQKLEWDSSVSYLQTFATRYPDDANAAYVFRRRLEALTPGDERDNLERVFVSKYGNTPAFRQYQARQSIGRPFVMPLELSGGRGKPVLIHFWSPASPGAACQLTTVDALAAKYKDVAAVIGVPVGVTGVAAEAFCERQKIGLLQRPAPEFVTAQGITQLDLPVSYFLAPDGTLAAIRNDARLDRPLARLIKP